MEDIRADSGLRSAKDVYRVILVDDSTLIRKVLKGFLASERDIEVIDEAENGQIAIEKAHKHKPDIIILDIEMPVKDGITALPEIMQVSPETKIIMCSTLTGANAEISIKAMAMGAADYIEKPSSGIDKASFKADLIGKIRAIGAIKKKHEIQSKAKDIIQNKPVEIIKGPSVYSGSKLKAIAIGSSTGGPQALIELFNGIGNKINDIPIFITQHMPPKFTRFLANQLAGSAGINCVEAEDGMTVTPGTVYIAPGDYHMLINDLGTRFVIKLDQGPQENFCRPSVDPMLRSLLKAYGKNMLVVILTGMGSDGAKGVKEIFNVGGKVLIQNEESSVVWGMPGAVAKEKAYNEMVPIQNMAGAIFKFIQR